MVEFVLNMDQSKKKINITTKRPEGQTRKYSNYVEISANPRDVSLKFCDLKPPAKEEEIDEIFKNGIEIPVDIEIVLPFDVAESLIETLKKQIDIVNEKLKKN